MKAAQIVKNSKDIHVQINNIEIPNISQNEVLLKVRFAAVNPLDIMNITGAVNLIQNYKMPLTLGNEVVGEIVELGAEVSDFQKGDIVYSRLPLAKIGAFAEYVSVDSDAVALLPKSLDEKHAAGVPLTGLTAYQALVEELEARPGDTLFIAGGSGSFGQMAVPIAKSMGLNVIVSGSLRRKEYIMSLGADQYIDYKTEEYWNNLSNVDYVIDSVGLSEIEHEFSILRPGGKLVSLISGPNGGFAKKHGLPFWKRMLFGIAGRKLDKLAKKYDADYRFLFVREDGDQLTKISQLIDEYNIVPEIDEHIFTIDQVNEALSMVRRGRVNGKVVIAINE